MEDIEMDLQALIRDINGNYGDDQPDLPYSPRPNTVKIYSQQPLYEDQATRLQDDHYNGHNEADLDAYDRALLAEAQPHTQWETSSGRGTALAGRLSLPGHTAPYSNVYTSHQRPSQLQHRAAPSLQNLRASLVRCVHTPPSQMQATSSPSNAVPSSPSFGVSQRRAIHHSQHLPTQIGGSSLGIDFPSELSLKMVRKRAGQSSRSNGFDDDQDRYSDSFSSPSPLGQPRTQLQIEHDHAPPIVQGIRLVSLSELPDRLRSVFRHPVFNAIQSKCFATAYKSNDNLVVSAPTGGGKTAILEMAICRLVSDFKADQYKIVYMAPTKSLCSERQRDWQAKFAVLDLHCAELTGDTDHGQLRNVQSASIVITTPEKWDSMTRKWKDHAMLMQMVKLFLIDEVHILKDARGATLEAVVSRMKSVGSNVRFVALSATVPNSEDIAAWLGKDSVNQHLPAPREMFGEEFRPVKLQKHVVGLPYRGNEFGFENAVDPQLPSIIAKYSHKKPIMVFCMTRKTTISTAKLLANVWASKGPRDRHWEGPTQRIIVQDPELKNTLTSGVAFHHAGLDGSDRHAVEQGFLDGQINVVCCTSTLAVGVNLPCHFVIIKNTVSYQDDGLKEYADLEIMQMLGRAGRPQFDVTAVAVIITKQEKAKKYERLVSGEELLESCLHLNLIDHLNAEIGLGAVYDLYTAKRWLMGTFLYVRLGQNPDHYKLDGDEVNQNLDDRIERICKRDLGLLEETDLVSANDRLRATEFGDAMARYYVKFETMRVFLRLGPRSKMSDILSALVQAEEFNEIRLKAHEKKLYKEINRATGIKFPIKVDLAMHAHKRSLIFQAELGGVDFPSDEQYAKHKRQYHQEVMLMFSSVHRLIRCVIDCQIHRQDAISVRHALELARSFGARVWDNSPYQMKQIPQIGLVAIRKLAMGGISSIEALEAAEAHRIEMIMSKNPPFGNKLLANLKDFPKLRVSVKLMGTESKNGRSVTIKIKAECGFMNDKVPTIFHRTPINVCLLTERSDGFLVDFRRISARKLDNGQDVLVSAELLSHIQYITCYVMCDQVAGTMRYAELRPALPAHFFPSPSSRDQIQQLQHAQVHARDGSKQQTKTIIHTSPETLENDEFGDNDLDDLDMMDAVNGIDFSHIDHFESNSNRKNANLKDGCKKKTIAEHTSWNPEKLRNGKWACNHKCKDKTACKHLCCREGVEKAKPPKNSFVSAASLVESFNASVHRDSNAALPAGKKSAASKASRCDQTDGIETVDLASRQIAGEYERNAPRELKIQDRLHQSISKGRSTSIIPRKRTLFDYGKAGQTQTSLLTKAAHTAHLNETTSNDCGYDYLNPLPSPSALVGKEQEGDPSLPNRDSSDYGSSWHDGLPSPSALLRHNEVATEPCLGKHSLEDLDLSTFNHDESDVEAAMVGLSDSITLNKDSQTLLPEISTTQERRRAATGEAQDSRSPSFLQNSTPKVKHSVKASSQNKQEKLFLSTDSPPKPDLPSEKRQISKSPGGEGFSQSVPILKRRRLEEKSGHERRASCGGENQEAAQTPNIKPGQPAWVYDFDPEFIAEWQDIVDFV